MDNEVDLEREDHDLDDYNYNLSSSMQGNRPRSAKTIDERNVRQTTLNQRDYIDRDRSEKKKKKGKYGITVPKPFGFDQRETQKKLSIREKRL